MKKIGALIVLCFISSAHSMEFSQLAAELGSRTISLIVENPRVSIPSALYAGAVIGTALQLDEKDQHRFTRTNKNNLSLSTKLALCSISALWHSALAVHMYSWHNE